MFCFQLIVYVLINKFTSRRHKQFPTPARGGGTCYQHGYCCLLPLTIGATFCNLGLISMDLSTPIHPIFEINRCVFEPFICDTAAWCMWISIRAALCLFLKKRFEIIMFMFILPTFCWFPLFALDNKLDELQLFAKSKFKNHCVIVLLQVMLQYAIRLCDVYVHFKGTRSQIGTTNKCSQ